MIQSLSCRTSYCSIKHLNKRQIKRIPPKLRSNLDEQSEGTPPVMLAEPTEKASNGKGLLAGGAIGLGLGLFLFTRVFTGGPSFADLEAEAVPLNVAQNNGKATVVEFYANWCEVCREMLPDTLSVETAYRDRVNFVALNVENVKWAPEMLEYGVDGIPHFEFINSQQVSEGSAVGRLPKRILEADLEALADEKPLPYKRVTFETSKLRTPPSEMSGPSTMPRSHGP